MMPGNGWHDEEKGAGRGENVNGSVNGMDGTKAGGAFKRWNGGGRLRGFTPLRFGDQEERRPVSRNAFPDQSEANVEG